MRQRRRAIAYGAQKRAAYQLATNITQTTAYQNSRHIAFYMASDGEIDLCFVLKKAWSQGKACYLPVIDGERLNFVHYTQTSVLRANGFGIAEPVCGRTLAPWQLDLVLTPVVAFDQQQYRIGMGGGYYDKTFAADRCACSGLLMGVAHRCQRVQRIVPQPWDIVLDEVVTN